MMERRRADMSSLNDLLARWVEDEFSVIHRVAKELEAHISEPGDERWRERLMQGQTRLLAELDQLARDLIDAEQDPEAAKVRALQ